MPASLLRERERSGRQQALVGGLGRIPAAPDTRGVARRMEPIGYGRLLDQAQHRLKQVVVDAHRDVEGVKGRDLFGRVEPLVADVLADERVVLLLDEAVVILLVGPTA